MNVDFNLYSIITLFALFLSGVYFVFLCFEYYKKSYQNKKAIFYYILILFIVIIWQSVELVNRMIDMRELANLTWRISASATMFLGYSFYFFVCALLGKKINKKYTLISFMIGLTLSFLALFSSKIIKGSTENYLWGRSYIFGQLAFFYVAYICYFIFQGIFSLIKGVKEEQVATKRKRYLAILIVHFLVYVLGILIDLLLPLFGRQTPHFAGILSVIPSSVAVFILVDIKFFNFSLRRLNIAGKLTLSILSIVFLVVSTMSFALSIKGKQSIEERTFSQLRSIAQYKDGQIEKFVSEEVENFKLITQEQDFLDLVDKFINSEPVDTKALDIQENFRFKIQKLITSFNSHVEKLIVINEQGQAIFSSRENEILMLEGEALALEDSTNNPRIRFFSPTSKGENAKVIISQAIEVRGGKLFVVAEVGTAPLKRLINEDSGLGGVGEAYLVSGDAKLLINKESLRGDMPDSVTSLAIVNCLQRVSGQGTYKNYQSKEVLGVYRWLPLRESCLLVEIDSKEVFSGITSLRNSSILVGVLVIFLALALSAIVAGTITRPINTLLKGFRDLERGDYSKPISIGTNDEIKQLSDAFNQFREKLILVQKSEQKYKQKLEEEVEKKTKKLYLMIEKMKGDQKILQNQRLAMANILEDVTDSQTSLKQANKKLEDRQEELLALRYLSEDLTGVITIDEVTERANGFLERFFEYTTCTFYILNPAERGSVTYLAFLNSEVGEDFLAQSRGEFFHQVQKYKNEDNEGLIKLMQYIKPKIRGQNMNNEVSLKPETVNYFPLLIGQKFIGLIQACSTREMNIGKEEKSFLGAFLNTLAFSLDRIQSLTMAQHSRTMSLVQSLSNGVLMFNNDKNIALINPAVKQFIPEIEKNLNLEYVADVLGAKDFFSNIDRAMATGAVTQISDVNVDNKFLEVYVTPVKDNDNRIVGGSLVFHDITYLKEIDQMKTEFVSVASHQLRTPLTAIKLFSNMLYDGEVGELNEKQNEYMSNIKDSTDRMVKLVNDLLNVTRIESGRLRVEAVPTEIDGFISGIIEEARMLSKEKDQVLVYENKTVGLPKIPLDVNLFRQVVHNLVVNAIRYSPKKKGKIIVTLGMVTSDSVLITVSDNGIGIPEESQKRMFEKFYRADNAIKAITEGTGLGLYVSKMIIELSGGKIWFESKKGKGSKFFVEMPIKGMQSKAGERGLAIS